MNALLGVGVQYHPEVAIRKVLEDEEDADLFMSYDEAMKLFDALIDAAE